MRSPLNRYLLAEAKRQRQRADWAERELAEAHWQITYMDETIKTMRETEKSFIGQLEDFAQTGNAMVLALGSLPDTKGESNAE